MSGRARALMIQGTGSHVGKSVIVAGLCRLFRRMGLRVSPFKSQNMALNSFITKEGGEIGRAQAYQAEAAGVEPSVLMNPVLLKANSDTGAQVIVKGRVVGNMGVRQYHAYKDEAFRAVKECYDELSAVNDLIVIEGAGSPAEVNLKNNDIVNMMTARMAGARVLIAADIDKGGVFASIIGTMEILDQSERDLVSGFIINKFRGDASLLDGGLKFVLERTGKPVVGVIPYFTDIHIQEEDGVALSGEGPACLGLDDGAIDIAVLRLGHISNFTDFDPLASEHGVRLRYVKAPGELGRPDMVIIPGSKNTVSDMLALRASGLEAAVREYYTKGGTVAGICGGYQMLGKYVHDPLAVETSTGGAQGMCLLDVETTLADNKITRQVMARPHGTAGAPQYTGYEIHMGRTELGKAARPLLEVFTPGGDTHHEDGAVSADGRVWGTYLHGIFENDGFRSGLLSGLGGGVTQSGGLDYLALKERGYDMLADHIGESIDMPYVMGEIGL